MALTGNKGEWTELYVLVKLLSDGKLFQSDINLNKDENNFYEVVKAYKDVLEFERKEIISLYLVSKEVRKLIGEFTSEYLLEKSAELKAGIINGKGKSFEIKEVEDFILNAHIRSIKAKSGSKSDIQLRIYDHRLAKETDLGFSIKSLLGADSTLLNTGPGNNFIYKVTPKIEFLLSEFNKNTYKPSSGISKLTYRLQILEKEYLSDISFKAIQSNQLWKNLKMVDGDLPEIIAYCLKYRWLKRESSIANLIPLLEENDPLDFYKGEKSEQKLYDYKIRKFLAECGMGMTSETPWHGIYDATGGVIICKEDGDIVCFHIYDFNLFRDYLVNNTIFEQPSTGEDGENPGHERKESKKKYYYGWLYEENEELLFKINLQIRFK